MGAFDTHQGLRMKTTQQRQAAVGAENSERTNGVPERKKDSPATQDKFRVPLKVVAWSVGG